MTSASFSVQYRWVPGAPLAPSEPNPPGGRPPRLPDRVRAALRARHYTRQTEKAYVAWIRRYILSHGKRHPSEMGAAGVTQYLSSLAVQANVAASTQIFPYRQVLEQVLPWLDDVVRALRALIRELCGAPRLMAILLYGSGLRLLECARPQVKDVDFGRNQITVRARKGDKDRVTPLPAAIRADLTRHFELVKEQHDADLRHKAGWVEVPWALARKYPHVDCEPGAPPAPARIRARARRQGRRPRR